MGRQANLKAKRRAITSALHAREARQGTRECAECTACCEVSHVVELLKPTGKRCMHARPSVLEPDAKPGCAIYSLRPESCKEYLCLWRMGMGGDTDRPDHLGVMFDHASFGGYDGKENQILIGNEVVDGAMVTPRVVDIARANAERAAFVLIFERGQHRGLVWDKRNRLSNGIVPPVQVEFGKDAKNEHPTAQAVARLLQPKRFTWEE